MVEEPGSLLPSEISLVHQTSNILLAVGSPVADVFYARLFALEPEARRMFAADLAVQKSKLTSMLASLIGALRHAELFEGIIRRVGQDHAQLGIERHH